MTSKPAPKAKNDKDAGTKKPGPRLVVSDMTPGIGHNSGEKHPEVIKRIEELMALQAQKKSIAKAERDIRNSLKTEFGVLSSSVAREVALRKLDPDVRVQVETNHEDLKKMLGYQPQIDFVGGQPTYASVKEQPSEAELAGKEGFEVNDGEESAEDDQSEGQNGMPPAPRGVITREG